MTDRELVDEFLRRRAIKRGWTNAPNNPRYPDEWYEDFIAGTTTGHVGFENVGYGAVAVWVRKDDAEGETT